MSTTWSANAAWGFLIDRALLYDECGNRRHPALIGLNLVNHETDRVLVVLGEVSSATQRCTSEDTFTSLGTPITSGPNAMLAGTLALGARLRKAGLPDEKIGPIAHYLWLSSY